jgi:hypothetical protein
MAVSTVQVRNMRYVVGRNRQPATGQLIITFVYLFKINFVYLFTAVISFGKNIFSRHSGPGWP